MQGRREGVPKGDRPPYDRRGLERAPARDGRVAPFRPERQLRAQGSVADLQAGVVQLVQDDGRHDEPQGDVDPDARPNPRPRGTDRGAKATDGPTPSRDRRGRRRPKGSHGSGAPTGPDP